MALTLNQFNNKKRVSLNRKTSSLVLDYQGIMEQESTNHYTRQLVASALNLNPGPLSLTAVPSQGEEGQLPRLLKSSMRTPKSAPCSPTKSVQFDRDNLENICYFKKAQTPLAISHNQGIFWADEEEEEPKLVFPNWSNSELTDVLDKRNKVIRIDKSSLKLQDKQLTGKVLVRNLDYQKTLTVRYTFDYWETVHDIEACYQSAYAANPTYDLFTFALDLKSDSLYFAVQYRVGAQEFWENNRSKNFEVQVLRPNQSLPPKKNEAKLNNKRYDFSHSFQKTPAVVTAIPIPIDARRSPNTCHSPSSPKMELDSASYMDLVSKYCFYSSSPTRSPMSTY
ncbi:putative phosphatase regulatory subunit-domain-containing protein [Sporodiniella umbellata]|nr:putative phosphatase regulatory subunit-domain-containing protein [Sporodiniella umbellata]